MKAEKDDLVVIIQFFSDWINIDQTLTLWLAMQPWEIIYILLICKQIITSTFLDRLDIILLVYNAEFLNLSMPSVNVLKRNVETYKYTHVFTFRSICWEIS